ncbi:hybrid sensor histidine kinase/response regulator transcription factor [Sphingobacterium sp. LRF_L2]|uniref:hybrid sensor histidine kinase/response regulator transcription factor n=1 Tax=Sphingobacterium sp. LRF_L2 TaxID=3369421 RepID=UPI003F62FF02
MRSSILKYITLTLYLLFFLTTKSQWNNLKFSTLSTKDGLSQNNIQCILEDKLGFIWFGTKDGLNRYDSYKFSVFNKQNRSSSDLLSNDIKALAQDPQQMIWVASDEGKTLNIIDPESGKITDANTYLKDQINLSNIVGIHAQQNGNLLLASRSTGLLIYDHQARKIKKTTVNVPIKQAIDDAKGNIWAVTVSNKIICIDISRQLTKDYLIKKGNTNVPITTAYADQSGNIWAGTYGSGLYLLNKEQDEFIPIVIGTENNNTSPSYVLTISEDIAQQIWIGTEGEGLSIYNPKTKKTYSYKNENQDQYSIANNTITSIQRDKKGNMWIGTANAGLSFVNIDQIHLLHYRHTKQPFSLSNNIVNCILQDSRGRIWIGTDGAGINLFDKTTERFYHSGNSKDFQFLGQGTAILAIEEDKIGNLWIGTWNKGLYIYNPNTRQVTNYNTSNLSLLKTNNVTAILRIEGQMLIGTYGGGCLLYDSTQQKWTKFDNKNEDAKLSSNFILSLARYQTQEILIGTESGSLNILDIIKNQTRILTTSSTLKGDHLSSNTIYSIAVDKNNTIWLGTKDGLNRLNIEKMSNKVYRSTNSNLPNDVIQSVINDRNNNIWMATNRGISKLNPENNIVQSYNMYLGLQDEEFRRAKLQDRDGNLLFGGNHGLNIFNPQKFVAQNYIPALVFTNFQLNNKDIPVFAQKNGNPQSINYTKSITLPYDYNVFVLEFASLNYTDQKTKQYAYKISGADKEWHTLGNKNYISFVRMPPGDYDLTIRATDNQGNWSSNVRSINIHIIPPFWETWWFRSIIFLLSIALAILFYFIRLRQIRKQNKILTQKVAFKTKELSERNAEIIAKSEIVQSKSDEIKKINKKIFHQQSQILQQNKELAHVNMALEASNKMKDKLFSILAHDLRNPITAIAGHTDFIKTSLPNLSKEEIDIYLDDFTHSTNAINGFLNNLLAWGKSRTNQLIFEPTMFNLYELVRKVIHLFKLAVQDKKLTIQVDIPSDFCITADYHMLYTILRNIINNSIKFTPSDGYITIHCETTAFIKLSITDSGVGMDTKQLEAIFNKNIQPTEGTEGEKGTGLGFQLCQDLIHAHGGTFEIHSEPDRGSTFVVTLPILNGESPEKQHILSSLEEKQHSSLLDYSGRRVLIIDDNITIRNVLRKLLDPVFEIIEAEDGKIGLEKAKETQPDLIITDLIMPEMDGLTFCKRIRANINTSHIPILMLTGEHDQENEILSYQAGVDIYLQKPFNRKLLFTVIDKFLGQQSQRQLVLSNAPSTIAEKIAPLDKEFLDKIREYVLANISDFDLNYKMICSNFGISRSILYAKFKTLTGQGVHDYIKNIRLDESLKLLEEGRMNISEIAYAVGFNSVSYYSKSFTKRMKKSPKVYQSTNDR